MIVLDFQLPFSITAIYNTLKVFFFSLVNMFFISLSISF